MQQFLSHVQNFLWGPGMLVLLLGTGLWLSWKSWFFQLRGWRTILRRTFGSLRKSAASADSAGSAPALTQFQTFSAALAAAMGTGNIIGVAGALCLGGAGAIFWMWISALLGMMLTYAENVLAVRYAGTHPDGSAVRGPMAYLRFGLGSRVLPFLYAVFCILASFGMGNMTQSSAISTLLQGAFPLPVWGIAAGIAVLLGCILLRGVRGAGSVLQWLMPLLAAGYMLAALAVILRHSAALPEAFRAIFRGAFGMRAVGGGISGAMLRSAIETGLRRGIFSNEAGLGSSALVHAGSDSKDALSAGTVEHDRSGARHAGLLYPHCPCPAHQRCCPDRFERHGTNRRRILRHLRQLCTADHGSSHSALRLLHHDRLVLLRRTGGALSSRRTGTSALPADVLRSCRCRCRDCTSHSLGTLRHCKRSDGAAQSAGTSAALPARRTGKAHFTISSESSTTVNGPSFSSSTCISAPKIPDSTTGIVRRQYALQYS